MNEQALSLAALNVTLLEAIQRGGAATLTELAASADIVPNNINRKLSSLGEAGLIVGVGEASHEVALTADGHRALDAMAMFRGDAPAGDGLRTHDGHRVDYIRFDQIDAWAHNPRTQFDPSSIEDMAQSIADKGILQPLTVRRKQVPSGAVWYEVIIGERRRRGARLAVERGWISAGFAVPCQIRDWDDDEALDVAGVENLQRQDLHWMDEARFYLRLAERGRSGAQIARLAGESVSKRKVQDYVKIARELPPELVERCYLPEDDKARMNYVQARQEVGEKREAPALDLSPKLALALLEIVDAGDGWDHLEHRRSLEATLHEAPVGGPLGMLQDRKLIACRFNAEREMVAQVPVTPELGKWLEQLAYTTDRPGALWRARFTVIGELAANALREGEYATRELNPPAEAAPVVAPNRKSVV